jgi:hypothetical protein
MAKTRKVNKSQAVRDYLSTHPGSANKEVAEALTKKGIEIKADYVATIKANMKKGGVAQPAAAATELVPAAVADKPEKPGDTLTLEHVKVVAKTVKDIGGFGPLNDLLGVIKEVGGMKRFRDLVEAMAVPEADDIKS